MLVSQLERMLSKILIATVYQTTLTAIAFTIKRTADLLFSVRSQRSGLPAKGLKFKKVTSPLDGLK
jgi:hypothetical protein